MRTLLWIVLLGWLLRVGGLFGCGVAVDYDEGVHYAAAALLARGVLPYRDFIFVHPPGIIYALQPLTAVVADPGRGLLVARCLVTLLGALNILLVGKLTERAAGQQAGWAAALFYAIYPEAVATERLVMLQPFLNTCILFMLLSASRFRAACWAGIGLLLKSWMLLALLAALPRLRLWGLWALLLGGLLALPLLGPEFYTQTVQFHFHRPVQDSGWWFRLGRVLAPPHLPILAMAVWGLVRGGWTTPLHREMGRLWLVVALAFVLAPSHYSHYNSFLALPESFWAGCGWVHWRRHRCVVLASLSLPLAMIGLNLAEKPGWPGCYRGAMIRELIPAGESVFFMSPGEGLLAGRLPAHGDGKPVLVDTYGAMLLGADKGQPDLTHAFRSVSAQRVLEARLRSCQWILLDARAERQLDMQRLRSEFRPAFGDLWRAR